MDKIVKIIGESETITEKELAIELDYMMKKEGAQKAAFDIIVTTGKRSAFPHSIPSDSPINLTPPLLVDCGAVYRGYHSDITRVMLLEDKENERIKEIYEIVRKAQKEALENIYPGKMAKDIDLAARAVIERAGFGEYFGHSTGHGIGLEVHEGPKINNKSETLLKPGMVFTIEPGIYLSGEFGIRWEDMVIVTENGYKSITKTRWKTLMPIADA